MRLHRDPPPVNITSAPRSRGALRRRRQRSYLAMMALCLLLIGLAWFWLRLYSTTAAVVMSAVAAVIPPLAAIVANRR